MSAKARRRISRNQRRELKTFEGAARYIETGWREGFRLGVLAGGGSALALFAAAYALARVLGW